MTEEFPSSKIENNSKTNNRLGDDNLDPSTSIQLVFLIILLMLSAFFSSAETALTTTNRHKMRSLAEEGDSRATLVLKLIENPGKLLSTILIGNNIVNLSASSLATSLAITLWGSVGAGIATGILTFLILIFGEITPKTFATLKSESISLLYARIIYMLTIILTPVIAIVNTLSSGLLFLLHIDPKQSNKVMTEKELRTIVDVSHEEGVIEEDEKEMINNVFDFGDLLAKEVMIPRIDITFAPVDISYNDLIQIFMEEQFSRLPVYDDTKEKVIGIVNLKDLYFYRIEHPEEEFNLRNIMRTPFFTYETQKISTLMSKMREESISFAIVLDEYGATAGLITLEDLIEEIIGEIRDEYDAEEAEHFKVLSEQQYVADASMKLDDLNDLLDLTIDSEDYDSIGGKIIELLDHLPEPGETAETEEVTFKVLSADKRRIEKVLITLKEQS